MFPFKDDQFAPRNRWYIAAWSDEISRDPIERWIMDECVALYRTQHGTPVALDAMRTLLTRLPDIELVTEKLDWEFVGGMMTLPKALKARFTPVGQG